MEHPFDTDQEKQINYCHVPITLNLHPKEKRQCYSH